MYNSDYNMIFWFFGFPGVGKDYCAKVASRLINAAYLNVDDFLTEEDKEKLIDGTFNQHDRLNKLMRVKAFIESSMDKGNIVVADSLPDNLSRSFLKKSLENIVFILVEADVKIHKKRLKERKNHFFTESLLDDWKMKHWEEVNIPHIILRNDENGEKKISEEFTRIYNSIK
jgi:gluconate kinase